MINWHTFFLSCFALFTVSPVFAVKVILVSQNSNGPDPLIDFINSNFANVDSIETATFSNGAPTGLDSTDIVVFSRNTNSGSYDDSANEIDGWNQLPNAILMLNPFILRTTRFGWVNTTVSNQEFSSAGSETTVTSAGANSPLFNQITIPTNDTVDLYEIPTPISGAAANAALGGGTLLATSGSGLSLIRYRAGDALANPSTTGGTATTHGGDRIFLALDGSGSINSLTTNGQTVLRNTLIEFGLEEIAPDSGARINNLNLPANTPIEPGYQLQNAFGTLSFNQPLHLATVPDDDRYIYVVEKGGTVRQVDLTNNSTPSTPFLDINDWLDLPGNGDLEARGENGLLACAFHPDYRNNGRIFIYYSWDDGPRLYQRVAEVQANGTPGSYHLSTSVNTAGSHQNILTQFHEASNHNGGDLQFGADGYLYIAVGDEGGANDRFNNANFINKDFLAAILRIDIDNKPSSKDPNPHLQLNIAGHPFRSAIEPGSYKVPADNPFVRDNPDDLIPHQGTMIRADQVRSEIWVSGLRNPFRFSFDRPTNRCFVADVGQGRFEEVNIVESGDDCGWSRREGFANFTSGPAGSNLLPNYPFKEPIHTYSHGSGSNQGRSITGGMIYRGGRLPELIGHYIFADFVSGNFWSLQNENGNWSSTRLLGQNSLAGFGADPRNADLLACSLNDGTILRLVRATAENAAPPTLSQTGAFNNLTDLTPATGFHAYDVNLPFWSDHALKRRWFGLPPGNSTMNFSAEGPWTYPTGQVWIKHFDIETTRGDSSTARKLETRFLVKTSTGAYGLSYRWREDGSDADLVGSEGFNDDLQITVGNTPITQTWVFPSRNSCMQCHRPENNYALSFNTHQLNRPGALGADQIKELTCSGFLTNSPSSTQGLPRHPALNDSGVSQEARVRAYLDVNCAMCHFGPNSGNPGTIDLRAFTPTDLTDLINGIPSDSQNDPSNRIVIPGDVSRSVLHRRVAGIEGRMPPLASTVIDTEGIALLESWINGDLTTRQTYAQWAASELASTPLNGPNDDADGDGQSNEMEFIHGTSPSDSNDRYQLTVTENAVTFPIVKNRSTLLEASFDLRTWFLIPSTLNDPTPPSNNGSRTIPITGDPPQIFLRTETTRP